MKGPIIKGKINLAPPPKESKKEVIKNTKNHKTVFSVYRPAKTIATKVEQISKEEKKKKAVNKSLKEPRKDKEKKMEIDDEQNDIRTDKSKDLPEDAWAEPEKNENKMDEEGREGDKNSDESAPDEVKMDERDSLFLKQANLKELLGNFVKSNANIKEFEDWRRGIQDVGLSVRELSEVNNHVMEKKNYSSWTRSGLTWQKFSGFLINQSEGKGGKNDMTNPMDQMNYFLSDFASIQKQMKDDDLKNFVPDKLQSVINAGYLSLLFSLIKEVDILREQVQILTLSLEDYTKEKLNREWKADQRTYQIERVVEKWLTEEDAGGRSKKDIKREEWEKKKQEKRKKVKEENIEKYKKEKTWISEEDWNKLIPGERVLKRWKFSDQHQVMDVRSWATLSKEQKKEFLENKKQWREKRLKEIEKEIESNPAKGNLTRRIFNFYNLRFKNDFGTYNTMGRKVENFHFRTSKSKAKRKDKN